MNLRFIVVCLLVLLALTPVGADQKSVTLTIQVNHTVGLSWTASTSTGVVGYRVYRAGVTGGPYSQIATQSGLTYTDTLAIAGQTYFYVVTDVDTNNNESPFSNEVQAVIPTP